MNKQNNRGKAGQMKRLTITLVAGMLLSLLVSSVALAELAEIKVGKGTLKIGGNLQAGYTYHMEDTEGYDSFTLNRARVLFFGSIIPDKVKYFVQLENKNGTGILDYKARFFYINNTEICFGRFLPPFTLYMPSATHKLEMINYPLTTKKFAMWRQVGLQTNTITEFVDFGVGIYNGADQKNNTADNNDAKDFLFRAVLKPKMEKVDIRVGGYAWLGFALPEPFEVVDNTVTPAVTTTYTFPEKTASKNRFGGWVKVDHKTLPLKIRGEFLMASDEYPADVTMSTTNTIDAMAYFAQGSYELRSDIEALVRYDFYDPNTDLEDDGETWLTIGVNYYLDGLNSMFYLNYIAKMEQGTDVDNDLLQAQVQIAF